MGLVGAATRWEALSDALDGSYTTNLPASGVQRVSSVMADVPAEAIEIIGSVTHNWRGGQAGGGSAATDNTGFKWGGSDAYLDMGFVNGVDPQDGTSVHPLAPGGGGWTPVNINASELLCQMDAVGTTMKLIKYWASGNYLVGGGGFAFLVVGLIGALLGANLVLADMPGISREAATRRLRPTEGISIIQPHEYAQALRELKEHPFRRYF
jgi:hypothetical protein